MEATGVVIGTQSLTKWYESTLALAVSIALVACAGVRFAPRPDLTPAC